MVASWGVFDSFWQGFSSAHDLFTGKLHMCKVRPKLMVVIDVGNGKEATDAKLRGMCEIRGNELDTNHRIPQAVC